jgi:hypothetical protein
VTSRPGVRIPNKDRPDDPDASGSILRTLIGKEPDPVLAAGVADELERLLDGIRNDLGQDLVQRVDQDVQAVQKNEDGTRRRAWTRTRRGLDKNEAHYLLGECIRQAEPRRLDAKQKARLEGLRRWHDNFICRDLRRQAREWALEDWGPDFYALAFS